MNTRSEKRERRGFTLVELLVVIAILALLLSVILPALNRAKLSARQVVCASRMRQWTLATLAYAGENNNEIPPYGDICDMAHGQNPVNPETYWHRRLTPYLTKEDYGKWGMNQKVRRCPMAKSNWGEDAVWIGVYYGQFIPDRAPFVYLNKLSGSTVTNMCNPFRTTRIKLPSSYLMLLDVQRDNLFEPIGWKWNTDHDGDGMNDSNSGILAASMAAPYNCAKAKIHHGGCNVSLFDGHVEWIGFETFWEIGSDGYPAHPFWFNQNRP